MFLGCLPGHKGITGVCMAWGRALTGVRFVSICSGDLPDFLRGNTEMTRHLRRFFEHTGESEFAIAAMIGRRCVGLFAFNRHDNSGSPRIEARGTYVCREYRRCGLARKLWQRALDAHADCEDVIVAVVAAGGKRLVASIEASNADRAFEVVDRTREQQEKMRSAV